MMPKVTLKNNGESGEIEEGGSLKDLVKEQGWPIAFACEDGMCGTCVIKTAQGGLSAMEDKEANTLNAMGFNDGQHRLACQCKVQADCEIEQP